MMKTIDESSASVVSSPHKNQAGTVSPRRQAPIVIWVPRLLLLTAIGSCIAGNACVAVENVCYNDPNADCAFDMTIEVTDARFATEDKNAQPSRDFWIKNTENINVSWQEYSVLMQRRDGPKCNFSANPFDTENCRKCTFCSDTEADRARCRGGFSRSSSALPTLLTYENFMSMATPLVQRPGDFCRDRDGQSPGGVNLMPSSNETLQLKAVGADANPIVAARVFVIAAGASQTVTYQLSPFPAPTPSPSPSPSVSPSPGASPSPTPTPAPVFYAGSIPRDPILADSYSSSLHITKVRVLKGKVEPDPNTGKLRLIEKDGTAPAPQPSRLIFVPAASLTLRADGNVQNDRHFCFLLPVDNNAFDLRDCHLDPDNPEAKLTREVTPDHLAEAPTDPLTWVVEFKVSQGAVIPTLDADEVMVIEFTIEVR